MSLNKVIQFHEHNEIQFKIVALSKSKWIERVGLFHKQNVKIKSKVGPFFLRTVFNKDYYLPFSKNLIDLAKEEYFGDDE